MDYTLRSTKSEAFSNNTLIVKHYTDDIFRLVFLRSKRNKGFVPYKDKNHPVVSCDMNKPKSISFSKVCESLSRSKRIVWEYALCNEWDYFFTGTIDKNKFDRYDLEAYCKKFCKLIDNYNFRNPDYLIKYVLIPEQHKDGAWHIHGLITGIAPKDLVFNKNGYLVWEHYDAVFGYMSLSKIRDKNRIASYITKYLSKSLGNSIGKGKRSFYNSKNLKRAEKILEIPNIPETIINSLSWDFEQKDGYCKVSMFNNINDVKHIISFLDNSAVMVGGASDTDTRNFLNSGFEPFDY